MRIRPWSDLHLEFAPFEANAEGSDVIVLAGDIDVKGRGLDFALGLGKPVVYVAGNHEYYGSAIPKMTDALRERSKGTQVHFLDRESVTIGGVRFLGATLWTDWLGDGRTPRDQAMAIGLDRMNDYRRIRLGPRYSRLHPLDTMKWHHAAVHWLEQELSARHDGPTVVVTHHAPLLAAVNPVDGLMGADASALDRLMGKCSLWLFGHTHVAFDQVHERTRVVSNPRGYPGEFVAGFQPDLTLTV